MNKELILRRRNMFNKQISKEGSSIDYLVPVAHSLNQFSLDIEPLQNLKGYSNSWPGGCGKNLIPYPYYDTDGAYASVTFSTDIAGHITASGTPTGGIVFDLTDPSTGITLAAGTYTLSVHGDHTITSEGKIHVRKVGAVADIVNIASGSTDDYVTFTLIEDTAINVYIGIGYVSTVVSIDCDIQLESGSSATSYEPYSNICSISGTTDATVYHSGKNLSLEDSFVYPTDGNVCVIAQYNLLPGKTYTVSYLRNSVTTTGSGIRPRFQYTLNGQTVYINGTYGSSSNVRVYKTGEIPNGATDIRLVIQRATAVTGYNISEIQLEIGDTNTSYQPSTYQTIPINLTNLTTEGIVYKGSINLQTGLLTITHGMVELQTSWSWSAYASNTHATGFRRNRGSMVPYFKTFTASEWESSQAYCSHFKKSDTLTASAAPAGSFFWNQTNIYFFWGKPSGGTTATQFKQYIIDQNSAGTPIQLVGQLDTQITYQLTLSQLTSLLGKNYLWIMTPSSNKILITSNYIL